MYDQKTDLRIARANTPIRHHMGAKGKVWFYVKAEDADKIAAAHPYEYLRIFETWKEALYNQCFFYFDEFGSVHVACPVFNGKRIAILEIVGTPEEDYIRIMNADYCVGEAEWVPVKAESRRIAKHRNK